MELGLAGRTAIVCGASSGMGLAIAEAFAAEVRELLASRSPEGIFWDWPGDTEVILAVRR